MLLLSLYSSEYQSIMYNAYVCMDVYLLLFLVGSQ